MADKTTNYNLTKPLDNEYYDIGISNGNMDIIDEQLKERDTRVGPLASLISRIKTSIVNAINGLQTDFNEHKADSTGHGTATKAEAQAGTSHASYMTPLRTKEAIQALQAVSSVNSKTGVVTLNASDIGALTATYGNIVTITANTTLSATHADKVLDCNNSANIIITVPTTLDIGTQITVIRRGTGTVTFAPAAGVTLNSKDTKRAIAGQHASATLVKVASTIWQLIGALE